MRENSNLIASEYEYLKGETKLVSVPPIAMHNSQMCKILSLNSIYDIHRNNINICHLKVKHNYIQHNIFLFLKPIKL